MNKRISPSIISPAYEIHAATDLRVGNRLTSMTSAIAPNNGSQSLASQSRNVDFSSVLSRTLQSIKDDPAQLRNAIYELARIKLQRECFLTVPPLTVLETRRLMLALETAIERVEAVSSQQDEVPTLKFSLA